MSIDGFWRLLASLQTISPWLVVSLCLLALLAPLALALLPKIPAVARLSRLFPRASLAGLVFSGAFAMAYYWTVGIAAFLILLVELLALSPKIF